MARRSGEAAFGNTAPKGAEGQRGNRGQSNRCVPVRDARRMEIAGTHAHRDVPVRPRWVEPLVHWRSRAICSDITRALRGAGESMRVIEVQEPGLLTTVQDLGREGFGSMGVSPSGAADAIALRIGNRLVGNVEGAAGLEMTLLGGTFAFPDGGVAALAGSDFGATLDAGAVPPWTSFAVKPGQTLRLGPTRSGARCYLWVRGGIDVKRFLGSASTHLLSGLGGHEGRALKRGDVLKIGDACETRQKGTSRSACSTG